MKEGDSCRSLFFRGGGGEIGDHFYLKMNDWFARLATKCTRSLYLPLIHCSCLVGQQLTNYLISLRKVMHQNMSQLNRCILFATTELSGLVSSLILMTHLGAKGFPCSLPIHSFMNGEWIDTLDLGTCSGYLEQLH